MAIRYSFLFNKVDARFQRFIGISSPRGLNSAQKALYSGMDLERDVHINPHVCKVRRKGI